jgi:20S proteasome alpha/beta subunit
VGSYEREACRAAGAAQSLVQPFLDNQVSFPVATTILSDVTCAFCLTLKLLDLLQEPTSCAGDLASVASTARDRLVDSYRLLHERN